VTALKKIVDPYRAIFPTPAALITSIDTKGNPNIATAGEVFMMSLKPLIVAVGFRQATHTNKLLHETKEFAVNLPKKEILNEVDYCGCVSGREIDKFKATKLTPIKSKYIKPPLILECPVNVECRIKTVFSTEYMDRDVFLGEALTVHVDEEIIGEDGLPDLKRFMTVAFASWKYYGVSPFLEKIGFSKKTRS